MMNKKGITLTIGQGIPSSIATPLLEVKQLIMFNAPCGASNSITVGYSDLRLFCEKTGLFDLFFLADGSLKGGEPGHVSITQENTDLVYQAVRFCPLLEEADFYPRLLWLVWWMRWAEANCDNPVIANS